MPKSWRIASVRIVPLVLAGLALANSGCLMVAAGVAAGGAAAGGYMYYKGNVTRDYAANLDDAWTAAHTALAELGMPVVKEDRNGNGGTIDTRTADGDRVRINFEAATSRIPAEGNVTEVGVRVAPYTSFGDELVSERVLNQIGAHLVPLNRVQTAAPPQSAPPPLLPPEPAPAWQSPAQSGK
jgi:hypothetical protein